MTKLRQVSALVPPWPSVDVGALAATPFFCEENVWHNLQRLPVPLADRRAVFVTNTAKTVAMWAQRAAASDPIIWDYHVVVVALADADNAIVVDVDCTAGVVLPLERWLAASFRAGVPDEVKPRFRVVAAADFLARFCTDRSHMMSASGAPLQPLPPWPAPNPSLWQSDLPAGAMNLLRWINLDDDFADGGGGFVTDDLDVVRRPKNRNRR